MGEEEIVYRNPISVASGSGKVTSISVSENQRVQRGELLFTLDDTDAKQNISNQSISVAQSKTDLEVKKEDLERTRQGISIPIDGVLSMLSIKEGETVSKNRQIATVTSVEDLEISVDIDELDIPKIKLGQSCTITTDALPGKAYEATVTYIAAIGVTAGGVTNYEVRAAIKNPAGILIGMNSTARIHVEAHSDTLYLPIQAVTLLPDGTYSAILEDPKGDGSATAAASVEPVFTALTTGLVNDNYIEVLDGLVEGQTVYYKSGVATDYFSQMFPMMNGRSQSIMGGGTQ